MEAAATYPLREGLMRVWQIVVPGLLGLVLTGCRSDPEIAYLQRDNLNKQKKIEQLQYRVDELEEALGGGAPAEPGIIRSMPEPGTTESSRVGPARARTASPSLPPGGTNSQPETPGPGILHISPGMEVTPGEVPDRLKIPSDGPPPQPISPPADSSSGWPPQWGPAGGQPPVGPSAAVPADNRAVAQITLHPALTGGIGTSARPSDEGLLVVVEPRDFGGNLVNAPGDISVALLDPAMTGEQARLARWDFAAVETERMVRTGSQPGIHLRLPWTSTPAHDRLKVFVRYTTRDGRKLQAERLIAVALNGPPPAGREAPPDNDPAQTASRPQRPQWSPVR